VKLLMLTATTNNWSNCTVLCVKKGRITGKDMTSWFSSTTMHHRTRQQWSKTTWRHSTGKCYPIPLIHQTWHLLTITCFRRWATRSLSGTSILRCPKMAWWVICFERWGIFLTWYTQIARKMGKMYSYRGQVLWINLFLLPRKKKCFSD